MKCNLIYKINSIQASNLGIKRMDIKIPQENSTTTIDRIVKIKTEYLEKMKKALNKVRKEYKTEYKSFINKIEMETEEVMLKCYNILPKRVVLVA